MAILVNFSAGETSVKTSSLHQWDYGQQLEIHSYDLPSLIEVHFACQGMNEAVVHSCSVENGVAMVDIPNRCLEQTNPITAWVYEIDGTKGTTTKTITIPIIARIRPGKSAEIPQDVSDQYTDLITEVNEAIESLKSGEVVIDHATHATSADTATTAGNASSANHAESATYATSAGRADRATYDQIGDRILTKYTYFPADFEEYTSGELLNYGTYQFKIKIGEICWYAIISTFAQEQPRVVVGYRWDSATLTDVPVILSVATGVPAVYGWRNNSVEIISDATIYYRRISY